jgi:hypothetical protein
VGITQKATQALNQNEQRKVDLFSVAIFPTNFTDYREGTFSFCTAIVPEVTVPTLPKRLYHAITRKILPWARSRPHQEAEKAIPVHRHIRRGWDHTNHLWETIVWPLLDCKLHPYQGESTAAWRMDWEHGNASSGTQSSSLQAASTGTAIGTGRPNSKGRGKAKVIFAGDSSASSHAGPRIVAERKTQDAEPLKKDVKGKRKEIVPRM